MSNKVLFRPGPTYVSVDVSAACAGAAYYHRSKEAHKTIASIRGHLKKLFGTNGSVMVSTSSASAVMEAAIRNVVGRKCLCLINGAFGARWARIVTDNGLDCDTVEVEQGKAIRPEQVETAIKEGSYDAVTVIHAESATGVRNPVAEITRAVRDNSDAIMLIDVVSSLAVSPVTMDEWGADVCIGASQKGLALPPGLAPFAVSDRAFCRIAEVKKRGYYLDFLRMHDYWQNNEPANTPAITLLAGLKYQLEKIFDAGLEQRFTRHRELAHLCQEWGKRNGGLFAETGDRTCGLTVIRKRNAFSIVKLNQYLAEYGFEVGEGYGALRDSTYRIGHMGDIMPAQVQALLSLIESFSRYGDAER